MSRDTSSKDSINAASKSSAEFSGRNAIGAAGITEKEVDIQDLLDKNGESGLISPPEDGFHNIHIGIAWNNIVVEQAGGFMGLIKKATRQGVDLDLGCLYELTDGTRGVLQPFGELFGNYNDAPFIHHSGDERTGDAAGDDESLSVNGQEWPNIKRILLYTYIYQGPNNWNAIKPEITINLNDDTEPFTIRPALKNNDLTICAIATLKNIKNGMQVVKHGEYFNSQAAMDRSFGFGLQWEDGAKN
ncbi:MAG: Tellurium resistance protein TerA [Alphaproteobacteria bacterium]|nr:MAG: Tellurium resistance protein TerA [Alphaproteobacteria bacterium]